MVAAVLAAASPAWGQSSSRPRPDRPAAAEAIRAAIPFHPLAAYWTFPFELRPAAAPATDGIRIFVPWVNGNLSALDITSGKPITARGAVW